MRLKNLKTITSYEVNQEIVDYFGYHLTRDLREFIRQQQATINYLQKRKDTLELTLARLDYASTSILDGE